MPKSGKNMILMRGLPSCGKSHRSRRLAGACGTVIEIDDYWYSEVGSDPTAYTWRSSEVDRCRRWTFARISEALDAGRTPLVIDGMNDVDPFTGHYVLHALRCDYQVTIEEPDSPWWLQIRSLLEDPALHRPALDEWAKKLTFLSRSTHRVPIATLRTRIRRWRNNVSVADYLAALPGGRIVTH